MDTEICPRTDGNIFVFGSNLAGRHGAGAAKYAMQHHGAIYGQGVGRQGNSYAIPTKDENLNTLPLEVISTYVENFIFYALVDPDENTMYWLTPIGCGLAGYTPKDIGPLFQVAPKNIIMPESFRPYTEFKYWNTI